MIRLETSKRTGIANSQVPEISHYERNLNERVARLFPGIKQRTEMSPMYNCHGMTFASRRTRVFDPLAVQRILADDEWIEIELKDVLPGDVVIYFDEEGDANHSGIVVGTEPLICSKWGSAGEFIHPLDQVPRNQYGPVKKFFRCHL